MRFREIGAGEYFPPIIPNGAFVASTKVGEPRREIFEVRAEGIFAGGIFLLWGDITGIVLDENRCRLATDKYRSGGIEFVLGGCEHRTEHGPLTRMSGYPVEYCLMNRVAFEQQSLHREAQGKPGSA